MTTPYQQAPGSLGDPSSHLLIEDIHQGHTSPAAQKQMDRYHTFVQEKRAPIAFMGYQPFIHSKNEMTTPASADASSESQYEFPSAECKPLLSTSDECESDSDLCLSYDWSYFLFALEPDLISFDDLIPTSRSASNSQPNSHRSSTSSTSSSRNHSPSHTGHTVHQAHKPPPTTYSVEPSILHTKLGGAAWNLDLSGLTGGGGEKNQNWVKTHDSNSKRGSRTGSVSSRKSSLNFGDAKLFSREPRVGSGHETSQQIWAMTQDAAGVRRGSLGALSHRSKEEQQEASDRLSEPVGQKKRLSLSKPYLKAHTAEQKIGVTVNSKPIHGQQEKKFKRASMPPIQNKRGVGLMNHRGSFSIQQARPASAHQVAVSRNRSQSLPSDSLFRAYSTCALPSVMTSSLAAMPIPEQPAIPVGVARRYSVLTKAEPSHSPIDEEAVHVDPTQVDGIDTSSTLDMSGLRDMTSESDDTYDVTPNGQPFYQPRMGVESHAATPVGSPIDQGSEPIDFAQLFPNDSSMTLPNGQLTSPTRSPIPQSDRVTHTQQQYPVGRARHSLPLSIEAPERAPYDSPDKTPQTSPTNLSQAIFKQTLITRRMSECVAKDITKKLRMLKKHMEREKQRKQQQQTAE